MTAGGQMGGEVILLSDHIQRRMARDEICLHACFTPVSGLACRIEILNISRFGFMARMSPQLAPGEIGTLALPLVGAREAAIVWVRDGRIGAEFAEPIDVAPYYLLLGFLTAPA